MGGLSVPLEDVLTIRITPRVTLERRGKVSRDRWAISDGFRVYTRKGWEREPSPSDRSDAFLERAYYPYEEALQVAERMLHEVTPDERRWLGVEEGDL